MNILNILRNLLGNLIYKFAFHLGMHILCPNGAPIADMLDHMPSLLLIVDYQDATQTMSTKDELGVSRALQPELHHRVLRVVPPAVLKVLLLLMDSFPILEHLCLSSTVRDEDILRDHGPKHVTLLGIGLSIVSPLLSFIFFIFFPATLTLADIQLLVYFIPKHLVVRLQLLPSLEELSIGFAIPIPRPRAEPPLASICLSD